MRRLLLSGLLSAVLLAQKSPNPPASRPNSSPPQALAILPHFEDIASRAGLTVSHISSPDKRYIIESVSGGVGLIDCDNDGKLDIIAVNGSNVDRYRKQGGDPMITLYHQDSDLQFSDITQRAGLNHKGWGMGVAVADYDNDGLADIYVTVTAATRWPVQCGPWGMQGESDFLFHNRGERFPHQARLSQAPGRTIPLSRSGLRQGKSSQNSAI